MMEILSTIIYDILKQLIKIIPNAIKKYKFRKFFGKLAVDSPNIYIVLDSYEHPIPRSLTPVQNRFIKKFYGRKKDSPLIGEDKLLGICSLRVTNYASDTFSRFRSEKNRIKVVLDDDIKDSWQGTFLCFGSSDSNLKTFDIEKETKNKLYSFSFDNQGFRCFIVNNQIFSISSENKDRAVLSRFINPYHSEHYVFVCAGLGEWGTSGAAYYLFNRWEELNKRFQKKREFCLIIEVNLNSDESAKEIYSYTIA